MTATTAKVASALSLGGSVRSGAVRGLDTGAAVAAAVLTVISMATPAEREYPAVPHTASDARGAFAGPLGRETVFGAYLGAPYHYPSDFNMKKGTATDFTIGQVEWYTQPFDNPLYYGARLQRWSANGRTGAMIDFVHSKAYAPLNQRAKLSGEIDGKPAPESAKIGDLFSKLEFTHGHNMLTLNGLLRFGTLSHVVVPYVGLGAGVSLPHSEMQMKGEQKRTYEYQYTGPAGQVVAGVELRLRTGSIFLEYKFTIADYRAPHTYRDGSLLPIDLWNQFSRWSSGEEPPGGWGSTRLASHQVVGGFLVRFVPDGAAAAR